MPATSFADYQVLHHGKFTLDAASITKEMKLKFFKPDNFAHSDGARKPVLSFQVRVHEETRLKVFVNLHEVLSWTLGPDSVKALWGPFNASVAFPENQSSPDEDSPTEVRFLVSTQGRADFENVILWHQVNTGG